MPINLLRPDLIRFSVTGRNNNFYNYIPVIAGISTKVFIHCLIHIKKEALDLMKKDGIKPYIYMCATTTDFTNEQRSRIRFAQSQVPVDELSGEDFLNLDYSFLLDKNTEPFDYLEILLYSSEKEVTDDSAYFPEKDLFFRTQIPVKEES